MPTFYKAVRPNGTDFRSGTIDYAAQIGTDMPVKHPNPKRAADDARYYISVSTEAGDCTGFSWPARLLEVKPVGKPWTPHKDELPNKRAVTGLKIIRELPGHLLLGPQGEALVALMAAFEKLPGSQRERMYRARDDAWYSAYSVASDGRAARAGLGAARSALSDQLYDWDVVNAAYGAALAVLLRHTIGKDGFEQSHYDALTRPWVLVTKMPAHPDDKPF